jgi:deoxycytidylate deaminase
MDIGRLSKIAEKISKRSDFKYKLGAVLLDKSRIISVGYNKNKSHTVARKYFCHGTIHAEIDAVLKSPRKNLEGTTIFVFRRDRNGAMALAKPCPQCAMVLQEYGVKFAVWSTSTFPFWAESTVNKLVQSIDKQIAYKYNKYPCNFDERNYIKGNSQDNVKEN